jgi:hypothetical protein
LPLFKFTWTPKHFSTSLFINHMVTPCRLLSRSFLHPITTSPPTHCLMWELYKSC